MDDEDRKSLAELAKADNVNLGVLFEESSDVGLLKILSIAQSVALLIILLVVIFKK